jgi:GntR family transcriptional regulator
MSPVKPATDQLSDRSKPAHARIETHLRKLIAEGHGRVEPLPTEQDLAESFGVSRMTARQAFQRLASSGVIVRYPSRGTFVAPRIVEDLTDWGRAGFISRWVEQGYSVDLRILAYDLRPAGADVARHFGIPPDRSLTYLERIRLVDGLPLALDRIYMPAQIQALVPVEEFENATVLAALPAHGIAVRQANMEIGARPADQSEAGPLGVRPGDTVVVRETLDSSADGELLVYELSVYPAARVSYRVRIDFVPPEEWS